MANLLLGAPNYCAASSFGTPSIDAAGSWESALPAANVLDRLLAKVARSTDATTASTKLRIDLGAPLGVRLVAVPKSNVSTLGLVRVSGYSDAAYSTQVATTGWVDYWQDAYAWGARPWGSRGLFSAKLSTAEAEGYPAVWYYDFGVEAVARYWEVEVDDTANADGYVELARVVLAPAWSASVNPLYPGTSISWETPSTLRRSRSGVRFVDAQAPRRVARFTLSHLPIGEVFANPFEMGRRADLSGEVFVVTDPDDTVHALRRAFMANFREIPGLDYVGFENGGEVASVKLEMEEVV